MSDYECSRHNRDAEIYFRARISCFFNELIESLNHNSRKWLRSMLTVADQRIENAYKDRSNLTGLSGGAALVVTE